MPTDSHLYLPEGIHDCVDMVDYLADPCEVPSISSGTAARIIKESPLHAWTHHARLNPKYERTDSTEMDIGTIAHDVLLQGGTDCIAVIDPRDYPAQKTGNIPKGWTNNAIRAARDDARNAGKTPVLLEHMASVTRMIAVAQLFVESSAIAGLFEKGAPEQTMIWREGDTWCRARPDWLSFELGYLVHYKTTIASAHPQSFIRGIMNSMAYDMALAFYERGATALEAPRELQHVILVQEQNAPYACSLIGLTPELRAFAQRKVQLAFSIWESCMRTGKWHAYPGAIHYAEPLPWNVAAFEELEMREFMRQPDRPEPGALSSSERAGGLAF